LSHKSNFSNPERKTNFQPDVALPLIVQPVNDLNSEAGVRPKGFEEFEV